MVRIIAAISTSPCYDANAIYQHLKFDREKKSQSVRQDSNPLYSVPYIRAQALGHHHLVLLEYLIAQKNTVYLIKHMIGAYYSYCVEPHESFTLSELIQHKMLTGHETQLL